MTVSQINVIDPYIGRVIPESDLKRFERIEEAAKALVESELGLISVREQRVRELKDALGL